MPSTTSITIKRYNGSNWDTLYPETTTNQVIDKSIEGGLTLTDTLTDLRTMAQGSIHGYATTLYQNAYNNPTYYLLVSHSSSNLPTGTLNSTQIANLLSTSKIITDSTDHIDLLPDSSSAGDGVYIALLSGGYSSSSSSSWSVSGWVSIGDASITPTPLTNHMKIGDNLYITNLGFPDYWVEIADTCYFSTLETQKPDLTGYVPTSRTVNGHALSSNVTVTASDVGLSNVENTKLSTWSGSSNITTIGTISSGTVPVARVTGLATVATSGSYSDLTNKPTIPATNVIPATTTANKILLSTSTSGTAAWSGNAIGDAAYKSVVTSISANDTSTNLPTAAAVENRINAHSGIDKVGTVTSVGISPANYCGLVAGSAITTSGNISLDFSRDSSQNHAWSYSSVYYGDSEPSNNVVGQILFEY